MEKLPGESGTVRRLGRLLIAFTLSEMAARPADMVLEPTPGADGTLPGFKPSYALKRRSHREHTMLTGMYGRDRQGYVYVLTNPAMPGVVKIGRTRRDPRTRLRELSSATGVPVPFRLAGAVRAKDADAAEREIHERLRHKRVSRRREFFRCDAEEALAIARRASRASGRSFVKPRQGKRTWRRARRLPPFLASSAATLAGWAWIAPFEPVVAWAWAILCVNAVLTGTPRTLADALSIPAEFRRAGPAATLAAAALPPFLGLSWEPALSLLPWP